MTWGVAEAWNAALEERKEREPRERDNLWASELGSAPVDIWLKMRGEKPSNPPNSRSLRKFEAGNVFEWIVQLVLLRAGVLKEQQQWSTHQYPNCLPVTGKADFIAGGKPDLKQFAAAMEGMDVPEMFLRGGEAVVRHLAKKYPDGLEQVPVEVKSVSGSMFELLLKREKANDHHRLQAAHYLVAGNYPYAVLLYICRDDLRLMEFEVGQSAVDEYKARVAELTAILRSDTMPEKEKPVRYDPDAGSFQVNWRVTYSPFLTKVYGYKDQKEFEDEWRPKVAAWNRVLVRMRDGKEMTKSNEQYLAEMREAGFEPNDLK